MTSEQLLTYGGVRLTGSDWMRLARECIEKEIGGNVSDLVESILEYSKDTDHGHGGHGKGMFSRHDVANYYGPEDLDEWSPRKCAEWAIQQGIPEKGWPNRFMLLLETLMEFGNDNPDATFWMALDYATNEKSDKLLEQIGPGVLMSELSRKQVRSALIASLEDRDDAWGDALDSTWEWRDLVEDNWTSDVKEWWTCSSWFAEKARPLGQCLLELERAWVWGREDSGQVIEADDVLYPIWASRAGALGYA